MSNEIFYEEMKQRAVSAKAKVPPNANNSEAASSHGPQHIFVVGVVLFAFSMGLLWLLITGEVKTKSDNHVLEYFLSVEGSAGKLLKGLVQIVFLQLLFISLGIFYKAFMTSFAKKEPDNFVDKVIDVVAKHLEPQKNENSSGDAKGKMQSTLLVSLVLAITVNISVSISNYFEHFKQSDEVAIALNEITKGINEERKKYNELRLAVESGFLTVERQNAVIEEQVNGQIANSNAALNLMATATDTLRDSIKNFDGISVSNSVSDVSEPIGTALNIENKVNIDNPDNRAEIKLLNEMLEALKNKNISNHVAMMDNMTSILCVKHEGFMSWAKNKLSAEERKNRLLCEKFKEEKQRLLSSIEKTKKESATVSIAEK